MLMIMIAVKAKFHYAIQSQTRSATRFELSPHVEIARTCLRQVRNQDCDHVYDLDSVMEFSLKQVAGQLANQLAR